MPTIEFFTTCDVSGPVALLTGILPSRIGPAIKKGAGRTAFLLQEMARQELDRLIYDTPESPYYRRTHTLWRSTYAARPGADHSRDHAAAFAGVDLGVDESTAGGVVLLVGYEATIDVGAWADWAWFVHEGYGQGNRTPKPFMEKPIREADEIATREIEIALAAAISGGLR